MCGHSLELVCRSWLETVFCARSQQERCGLQAKPRPLSLRVLISEVSDVLFSRAACLGGSRDLALQDLYFCVFLSVPRFVQPGTAGSRLAAGSLGVPL